MGLNFSFKSEWHEGRHSSLDFHFPALHLREKKGSLVPNTEVNEYGKQDLSTREFLGKPRPDSGAQNFCHRFTDDRNLSFESISGSVAFISI
jgi:hypothetical protein